ncbi:L-fucose:H+ symporter permease [Verrucomicrobiota bacterium]
MNSWISGETSDKIDESIDNKKPIDWTPILTELKSKHTELAAILRIVETDKDDSAKWEQIQSAGLDAAVNDKAREAIVKDITIGEAINWGETPLLAGIPDEEQARRMISSVDTEKWSQIQQFDLNVLQKPYFAIGLVILIVLVIFFFAKLPASQNEDDKSLHIGPTLKRLFSNKRYIEGVVAQAFYVGAQIMCWTFIIQYAASELDMPYGKAQGYNIAAMIIFCSSRFVCTFLLKFFKPGALLGSLAIGGFLLTTGTIFIRGMTGLYCLVGVSACMSLMFPTIYGIALRGLGDDAKLGAAGLIMAIGGGCLMPPMQGWIMDQSAFDLGFMELTSARASFVLPLICFAVITHYGFRTFLKHDKV